MSLSAYSSTISPLDFRGMGGGGGAYLSAFFFTDYTDAVVLTSGLSVLLASNAVLF